MTEKILSAVFALTLQNFDNMTLAILAYGVQAFGKVDKQSLAYKPALDAGIINEFGNPVELESLRDACAFEVNRRVKEGTFN